MPKAKAKLAPAKPQAPIDHGGDAFVVLTCHDYRSHKYVGSARSFKLAVGDCTHTFGRDILRLYFADAALARCVFDRVRRELLDHTFADNDAHKVQTESVFSQNRMNERLIERERGSPLAGTCCRMSMIIKRALILNAKPRKRARSKSMSE